MPVFWCVDFHRCWVQNFTQTLSRSAITFPSTSESISVHSKPALASPRSTTPTFWSLVNEADPQTTTTPFFRSVHSSDYAETNNQPEDSVEEPSDALPPLSKAQLRGIIAGTILSLLLIVTVAVAVHCVRVIIQRRRRRTIGRTLILVIILMSLIYFIVGRISCTCFLRQLDD